MAKAIKKQKTVLLILSGITLFYCLYIGIRNVFRYNAFRLEYKSTQQEYLKVLEKNHHLKKELQEMDSTEYWEKRAKQDLGLIKKGEHVIKLHN